MPSNPFNESIAQLVAAQVEAQLAPHLKSLHYLEEFLGKGGVAPTNGRRVVTAAPSAGRPSGAGSRGPKRKLKSPAQRGDPSQFSIGTRVEFRLGRGSAQGTVTAIDVKRGSIFIQRDGTKTVFQRPAVNLILASGGGMSARRAQPARQNKAKAPAQRSDASHFSTGDHVQFKLGRGSTTGTVTSIDNKKGSVFIRRDGAKTIFQRPAVNVMSAGASA